MRRFIAGAVCPQCRQIDRTVIETTVDGQQRRCVACGHAEALVETRTPEPATRLTSRASAAVPVQAVRLIEPVQKDSAGSAEDPSK